MNKYKKRTFDIYIEELSSTNLQYAVSVSQDNWVYAPYGGYWDIDKYSNLSILSSSIGGNLALNQIYISNNMVYATISNLIGTKIEINSIEEAEKIMHNLGYDDEKYTITSGDVISVILTDIGVISGVYSLGGVIEEGLVAIYETKFAISGAISTSSSVAGLIFTPNLNLIEKFNNYMEKLSLNDSVSNNNYNIYCTNQIGFPKKTWNSWEKYPYINKFDSFENRGQISLFDLNSIDFIIDYTDWGKDKKCIIYK